MLIDGHWQGIACGGGTLHCTDNDHMEASSLDRDFLFRKDSVGTPKSVTAAAAVKAANPALNVHVLEEVGGWRSVSGCLHVTVSRVCVCGGGGGGSVLGELSSLRWRPMFF